MIFHQADVKVLFSPKIIKAQTFLKILNSSLGIKIFSLQCHFKTWCMILLLHFIELWILDDELFGFLIFLMLNSNSQSSIKWRENHTASSEGSNLRNDEIISQWFSRCLNFYNFRKKSILAFPPERSKKRTQLKSTSP